MSCTRALLGGFVSFMALAAAGTAAAGTFALPQKEVKHVLLLSIDGLHEGDLARYLTQHPQSALAALAAHGAHYTSAATAMPSDSFPGLLAMLTGGTPKSTGVYYDDSYDRTLSAPGSNCATKGTEVVYDESIDKNPDALDAGGGINPAALPLDPAKGCKPVYPHEFLRVNTIFEVVKAAGGRTAWADKHPAYDIVNGPSGAGVDDLFTPEINANGITDKVDATEAYDDGKVEALLHQIDGLDHAGQTPAAVPALFGMNFQAVSVAQKLAGNGYADASSTPSAGLADAIAHTDASIGRMVAELKAKGLFDKTLIIVSAKHGQSPIDPAARRIVDKKTIPGLIDAVKSGLTAQATQDSVSLIWLADQTRTADAVKTLTNGKNAAAIDEIYGPDKLRAWYGDAATDPRVPDIIVQPQTGVIYTKPGASKIAEHGGFSADDTHVPILVSYATFKGGEIDAPVHTTQIAPTILLALGLDPAALQAVKLEQTAPLPGITPGLTN
jgi:predicted AlkP superfamily pyrophosphatase or phosphodiesterase